MTIFQFLYNVQTHWPVLSCNRFCNIQQVSRLELPCKYWGSIHPHMIFQRRKPFLKAIYGRWGTFLGQIYWATVLHGELMIRSCQERVSFTNTFFSILKNLNFNSFANHEGIYTRTKIKPWPVIRIVEAFILQVNF